MLCRAHAVRVSDLRRQAVAEADVQSAQVRPAATVPSPLEPVRMSCGLARGAGPLSVDALAALVDENRRVAVRACSR